MCGAVVDVRPWTVPTRSHCDCGEPVARGRRRYCSARCAEAAASERHTDLYVRRNRARVAREQKPCRVCQEPIVPGHRVRETCSNKCYRRLFVFRQWVASVAA
jgi:predicted nucleic acid-binding Zn ribbon protein